MSSPSNLYAEKVFSEHPTVLWSLDDKADYISLIEETERDIENYWTIENANAVESFALSYKPFSESILTKITGDVPAGATSTITLISEDLVNFTDLNSNLGSFCIGGYFYFESQLVKSFSIGYEYTDTTTSTIVQKVKTSTFAPVQEWIFLSETFETPNENTNLRVLIQVVIETGGTSSDYDFYINGITVGQWSEEFNARSLGITPISIPTDIAQMETQYGIEAETYGLDEGSAYYLINNNSLVAKNNGVPMVYGASNVTKLTPNTQVTDMPSFIFPGKGFLNKDGQYKQYTVEFWIKINSSAYTPRRIFGPIGSTDGLYVESGFLTLVIGNNFASHFVGEWFRPMLMHISVIENSATVLINGEQVISLSINTSSLNLPDLTNQIGKSLDWLGFYCYADVPEIELDCIAIYSYRVPEIVAKRRFVYGQGVSSQDSINSSYGGSSAVIDYPFSKYAVNYSYPDFAQWQQGTFDNLTTTTTSLSTPQYSLPNIFLSNKTLQELYEDNYSMTFGDYLHLSLNPNSGWDNTTSYINFNNFNILNSPISAIYGVFECNTLLTEEILFKIYNESTGDYFAILKNLDDIQYFLNFNGVNQELHTISNIVEDEKLAVGINIDNLVLSFAGDVSTFFGNRNNLKIYVAGDETGTHKFTGKIYTIGLCTSINANDISSQFDENGIAILDEYIATGSEYQANAVALIEHTASYTLLPLVAYNTYFLDIGVSGYWEDYLPLSYFAKFVKNDIGNDYYHLDFLQFNIGYPSENGVEENEITSSWTYHELMDEYGSPTQQTYSELDNSLYTNWNNYEDMSQKSIKYYEYNTENALVKSYITFQYIEDGANAPKNNFTITEPLKSDNIVDMENYSNWLTTRFSVMNNTLIYPSRFIDFNDLALVYHLEFNIRGILTKPIALRRLELSSQVFNNNSFNPVGTKLGLDLFPYTRSGIYYDYKAKNPFTIYKGSTPYLYLTKDSGIEMRGSYNPFVNRGISLPVNSTIANNYKVSALQIWMRYDKEKFTLTPIELFDIKYKEDTIKFYMVANSEIGNRAKIYAKSLTSGQEFNNILYYWNGNIVREPVMTTSEWGVLSIAFPSPLNFDSFLGSINISGPVVFNNLSFYQANSLQQTQSTVVRSWLRVKSDGITDFDWDYWNENYEWAGVLVISASNIYGINPSDVYKTYMGTNKIIIDDNDGLGFTIDSYQVYSDTEWSISSGSAV
jgi:hypothetical protein